MDSANAEPEAVVPVVFGRSSKKRKAYRQRGADTADETTAAAPPLGSLGEGSTEAATAQTISNDGQYTRDDGDKQREVEPKEGHGDEAAADDGKDRDDDEHDAIGLAVSELLRRRKQRKPKVGGVEFRDDSGGDRSLVPSRYGDLDFDDMDFDFSSEPMAMGIRFAPQTGLIGDLVNKHMEDYIDAQLAKRHQTDAAANANGVGHDLTGAGSKSGAGSSSTGASLGVEAREQLAMKGKLHEIDLGSEAKARNVAMTQHATQQLRGPGRSDQSTSGSADKQKSANRKRRGSNDVERDQIVEQFLHENRMDVDAYQIPRDSGPTTTEGRPADDRIAEQFRREFMEAVAQRMRRKRKPLGPPAKPKVRNEEEILRGPKLGGSRNVRSVMRDKLLQKQEEERQNMPKYEQQLQEQKRRAVRRR